MRVNILATMSRLSLAVVLLLALQLGAFAKDTLKGHPNLDKAKTALADADKWITEAQKANEWDEGGHAAKAKDAIATAKLELDKAASAKKCEGKKPIACPGGGAVSCEDGTWKCPPLPTRKLCDDTKKPAACPGGGAVDCVDGQWKCHALPQKNSPF